MLRSAVGMTHVLRGRLVMGYTTLALKLSVAPPVYPWVTATARELIDLSCTLSVQEHQFSIFPYC